MSIEQRLEQVEKQTKRLRIAVVVLVATLCGVVSMAATEGETGSFEVIFAKRIYVQNDKDEVVIGLTSDKNGAGLLFADSATGKTSVMLSSTGNGGDVSVYNKTGEMIVTLEADDYGNGVVGAWDRKGKGRVFDSQ